MLKEEIKDFALALHKGGWKSRDRGAIGSDYNLGEKDLLDIIAEMKHLEEKERSYSYEGR